MSVEELSLLHRRYVELSQRFRAAWVFHQFLQSLAKLYFEGFDNRYPAEFQTLYAELKEVSQNLNAAEADRLDVRFDSLERRLGELVQALLGEDSRVDPAFLRQFFQRFRSYDEKILIQLVRFYAYAHPGGSWDPDRLDKVDYLLTRLGEEEQDANGQMGVRERKHLEEVFRSLAALIAGATDEPEEAEVRRRAIDELRVEFLEVDGLDTLNHRQLVPLYRTLKHSLGELFFAPEVLMAILEANLAVKNTVRRLYRREERRIYSEYQQIFDLEREVAVGDELDEELMRFRSDIERFEQQVQSDDLRLDELARLREQARVLVPRLTGQPALAADGPAPAPAAAPETVLDAERPPAQAVAAPPTRRQGEDQVVGAHFQRLLDALDATSQGAAPKTVVLTPDLFPFRLEPREVVAYRRLAESAAGALPPGASADAERFVLLAAALRVRMAEEAEELQALLDGTAGDAEAAAYTSARATAKMGDAYLGRFAHLIHQAVIDGHAGEAQHLELLRMRLMQDYAKLWLLAYKATIAATEL